MSSCYLKKINNIVEAARAATPYLGRTFPCVTFFNNVIGKWTLINSPKSTLSSSYLSNFGSINLYGEIMAVAT